MLSFIMTQLTVPDSMQRQYSDSRNGCIGSAAWRKLDTQSFHQPYFLASFSARKRTYSQASCSLAPAPHGFKKCSTFSSKSVTTHPLPRRVPRTAPSGWPPVDCIPGRPWSGDSWRCGKVKGENRGQGENRENRGQCGLARPRVLAGASPAWVIVSREPSIEPCGVDGNGHVDA